MNRPANTLSVHAMNDCLLCRWDDADREFHRVEVWRDELWRLTVSVRAPVLGFAYLEPKRHIPYITDLDGAEARSLGPTLARVTRSLKDETGAELIYVNVHGDRVAHLHFNLAPHKAGYALIGAPGMIKAGTEPLPEDRLRAVAAESAPSYIFICWVKRLTDGSDWHLVCSGGSKR